MQQERAAAGVAQMGMAVPWLGACSVSTTTCDPIELERGLAELQLAAVALPVAQTDLRAPAAPVVRALDASPAGGGIMQAPSLLRSRGSCTGSGAARRLLALGELRAGAAP